MFSRIGGARAISRVARRYQSHAAPPAPPAEAPFNNKYNFNTSPPPIHLYWEASHLTTLLVLTPVLLGVGYGAKYIAENLTGFQAFEDFADSEQSPMKTQKFGEPQQRK